MKKYILALVFMIAGTSLWVGGCSSDSQDRVKSSGNVIARMFGTTGEMTLPPGHKLVSVTWKEEDSMWILHRPMRKGEFPETYIYEKDSYLGMLEGRIIIKEVAK